jgi:hypothetical protein
LIPDNTHLELYLHVCSRHRLVQNLGGQGVGAEVELQEFRREFLLQLGGRLAQAVAGEEKDGVIVHVGGSNGRWGNYKARHFVAAVIRRDTVQRWE